MRHSTGKPMKAEQERLDAIHAMPCIACESQMMQQPSKTEAHHLVDKGYRTHSGGHMATLPACGWHHRGELLYPLSSREMKFLYGPSLTLHKRETSAPSATSQGWESEVAIKTQRACTDPIVGKLIQLAAKLARGEGVPREFDVSNFYASTPMAERRRIVNAINGVEETHKVWAIELRRIADELSARTRAGLETGPDYAAGPITHNCIGDGCKDKSHALNRGV